MKDALKNKKVIVRADGAGVLFGTLADRENSDVLLEDVRKIHWWEGACAVEQIAVDGVDAASRLTVVVGEMIVFSCDQLLPCTDKAILNLTGQKEWKI